MTPASPSARSARRLPWFPIATCALGAVGILSARLQPELDGNLKAWITASVALLVLLLNLLWFLFTPRFSWRTRLGGLLGFIALVGGARSLLLVDGTVGGSGLPNFVGRWQAKSAPQLATLPPPATAAAPINDPRLAQAADASQFFGSSRDGSITGTRLAPDWQTNPPRELWRQPIGAAWSGYAVVGGRAFTQEQRGEEELVTCYDLFTGKLLWAHADHARFFQWQGGEGPRATPTVVDGRVFSCGATGILNCLDAQTGQLVWTRSVLRENGRGNLEWGMSASPLVFDDRVVVTAGTTEGPVLFAYQRETGEPLWKAGQDRASYASPTLATLAGRRVVLSNNAAALTFHDPTTGTVLLAYRWGDDKWPKASQPLVIAPDQIFVSAGYGMGARLAKITATADGKLAATELWRSPRMKTQFNSAAILGGYVYGLDDGRLACVDLATGDRKWKDGRFGAGQSLLAGDLLLIQSERGPVYLAAAQPESYRELGRIDALSSKTWNFPTLAGRYLLVRNDREAACYELPVADVAPPKP